MGVGACGRPTASLRPRRPPLHSEKLPDGALGDLLTAAPRGGPIQRGGIFSVLKGGKFGVLLTPGPKRGGLPGGSPPPAPRQDPGGFRRRRGSAEEESHGPARRGYGFDRLKGSPVSSREAGALSGPFNRSLTPISRRAIGKLAGSAGERCTQTEAIGSFREAEVATKSPQIPSFGHFRYAFFNRSLTPIPAGSSVSSREAGALSGPARARRDPGRWAPPLSHDYPNHLFHSSSSPRSAACWAPNSFARLARSISPTSASGHIRLELTRALLELHSQDIYESSQPRAPHDGC